MVCFRKSCLTNCDKMLSFFYFKNVGTNLQSLMGNPAVLCGKFCQLFTDCGKLQICLFWDVNRIFRLF